MASHQRQLVLVVEGTAALGQSWTLLRSEYIDKIIRSFHGTDGMGQKPSALPGEMSLIVFYSHGSHSGCLLQQTGWTTNLDVFLHWISCINFVGGGFGEAAIAEGLAEALLTCCPNSVIPPVTPLIERQKHCILVAASNPHRLPTPIPRPPLHTLIQPSTTGDSFAEHWWLTDADTVAKAFPQCLVSLSVIAPRRLPLLESIYNGGKRIPRGTDSPFESAKYPYHMVLLPEGFMEARLALSRATGATATSNSMPPAPIPKIESVSVPATSAAGQTSGVASRASAPAPVPTVAGRQGTSNGIPSVAVKTEIPSVPASASATGLHHVAPTSILQNLTPVPVAMQLSSTSALTSQDPLQPSLGSDAVGTQDFKPPRAVGTTATIPSMLVNPSQARQVMGSTTLPGANTLTTSSFAGIPVSNMISSGTGSAAMPTTQSGLGVAQAGLSISSNSVGLRGMGPGGVGLGGFGGTSNLVGSTTLGSMQPGPTGNNGIAGVQGVQGLASSGTGLAQAGMPGNMGRSVLGLGAVGGSSGGGTMIPTPGLPPQVQGLPTQPQAGGSSKYRKLWQGALTGQRQQKPVFICQLEAYRQESSPETLAADWPQTMQICRLIAQDYMNSKNYQGKSELLVFRTLNQHGFLSQLADKKLCAVIQLPSQTLLLASSDKPGRMIGMLFPGDMVVFKPQIPSQQQQAQTATSGIGQSFSQSQLPVQALIQSGQLPGQLPGQGPASLSGAGFLP